MPSRTYVVRTLGCKANLYDSQLIEAELQRRGWKPGSVRDGEAELCIVNSCTVTDEADRQSRKMASRLARENPNARVVITGCSAEVDPERLLGSKGIHYVIGNRDKPELVNLILERLNRSEPVCQPEILGRAEGYEELLSRHPIDREWPIVDEVFVTPPARLEGRQSSKTRAFLKIQEGCNSFCTYCIIPYGRGPSRSLRPREIIEQVRRLIDSGIREIVITGTNIGDYGMDWAETPQLTSLLEMILKETSLERLRVSSLDPTEVTDEMMALMAREPRFCPHFHVSLQSASDRVLRLMKRRYGFTEVERCLKAIAAIPAPPGGVFVGMDVICGFPGETDEEFELTYRRLEALPWARLHVFPYSEREGTPATRLPQAVPRDVRGARARRLADLSLRRMRQHYEATMRELVGGSAVLENILLERPSLKDDEEWVAGYTPNYLRVLIPLSSPQRGVRNQLVRVRPTEVVVEPEAGEVAFSS